MKRLPVIAILDVGKTNKKLFLLNEAYTIVYERSFLFAETIDEDGFPCEDLDNLISFVTESVHDVLQLDEFDIKAINFSTYGASLVYVNEEGKAIAPLYNYLKDYPAALSKQFYETYGGEDSFSGETASPVLGSLNAGMQLYRFKYEQPGLFAKMKYAFHLPQYISYLLTAKANSDITSIGCHTGLWNFKKNDYHHWVNKEAVLDKLPAIIPSSSVHQTAIEGKEYKVGVGLHDSSAALIPYIVSCKEPFVLISTGTWCITLNPFNHIPLTAEELKNDCLCYMQYKGLPVKAARLFAGKEHEEQVKRIAAHFDVPVNFYQSVQFDPSIIAAVKNIPVEIDTAGSTKNGLQQSSFENRNIHHFASAAIAYHQLMIDIIDMQFISSNRVIKGTDVKKIFVDGGFAKNKLYMHLLADAFPGLAVFAASMVQGTAVGTALSIHEHWNTQAIDDNLIALERYSTS